MAASEARSLLWFLNAQAPSGAWLQAVAVAPLNQGIDPAPAATILQQSRKKRNLRVDSGACRSSFLQSRS
jgi:hypothetical protein